ncbi:MAG: ferredoxin:glutaredoxin reductase [Methanolinea sp.]|nr:ferredoxin:glutaredoxin reductase [Methanolinea sp.]
MSGDEIGEAEAEEYLKRLQREASEGGYLLNPDHAFILSLAKGLRVNERRYGYPACPCRLASGRKEDDLDIICPCDYRDPDLDQFGACYCSLYVSPEVSSGEKTVGSIPERRPPRQERARIAGAKSAGIGTGFSVPLPVWRCKVCGYLCAREQPPLVCPVCKAKKDRFERFL